MLMILQEICPNETDNFNLTRWWQTLFELRPNRDRMLGTGRQHPGPTSMLTAKHGPTVVNNKGGCGTAALWNVLTSYIVAI